jgi:integrase
VSQCFIQGIDEGTIRSWLGHSDSRILEIYRHLAAADSKRLMDKLDFSGRASDT